MCSTRASSAGCSSWVSRPRGRNGTPGGSAGPVGGRRPSNRSSWSPGRQNQKGKRKMNSDEHGRKLSSPDGESRASSSDLVKCPTCGQWHETFHVEPAVPEGAGSEESRLAMAPSGGGVGPRPSGDAGPEDPGTNWLTDPNGPGPMVPTVGATTVSRRVTEADVQREKAARLESQRLAKLRRDTRSRRVQRGGRRGRR